MVGSPGCAGRSGTYIEGKADIGYHGLTSPGLHRLEYGWANWANKRKGARGMSYHRITLSQQFRGRTFQNVFHVLNPDGLINDQTIALTLEQHWIEHFRGCQFSSMQYFQIIIQRLFENP